MSVWPLQAASMVRFAATFTRSRLCRAAASIRAIDPAFRYFSPYLFALKLHHPARPKEQK